MTQIWLGLRIDPTNPAIVEFAFKNSLAGPSFMWGVWADAGLKNPGMFNYNDRFTYAQAGSPIAGNPYYPIKAIYAADNTCRAAYGFTPIGDEPLLCPPNSQTSAATPSSSGGMCPNGTTQIAAAKKACKGTFYPATCLCAVVVGACPTNPLPLCGKQPTNCPCRKG